MKSQGIKICRSITDQKKARVAILISDSTNLRKRKIINLEGNRGKDKYYIMIKGVNSPRRHNNL